MGIVTVSTVDMVNISSLETLSLGLLICSWFCFTVLGVLVCQLFSNDPCNHIWYYYPHMVKWCTLLVCTNTAWIVHKGECNDAVPFKMTPVIHSSKCLSCIIWQKIKSLSCQPVCKMSFVLSQLMKFCHKWDISISDVVQISCRGVKSAEEDLRPTVESLFSFVNNGNSHFLYFTTYNERFSH